MRSYSSALSAEVFDASRGALVADVENWYAKSPNYERNTLVHNAKLVLRFVYRGKINDLLS